MVLSPSRLNRAPLSKRWILTQRPSIWGLRYSGETIFTSDYGIFTEGRIVRGKSAEPSDNPDNIGSNNVIGGITAFGYDGFLFNGSLRNVQTFKGSVSYRLYDMS